MLLKLKNLFKKDFSNSEIINVVLYSMILIMPFVLSKNLRPNYLMGKVIFTYILGVLLLILLVKDNASFLKTTIKANIKLKKLKISNIKNFFKHNLENKSIVCMFLSMTLCSILGPTFMVALLGNKNRYEGLLIYAIYFLFFIAARKYMKLNKTMIEIISLSACLMSIITIMQLHNFDPILAFLRGDGAISSSSEFGTIGNRNFLSTYLLLFEGLTLSIYIFLKNKRYLLYSAIIFAGILSGQTRGVWIGFLAMSFAGFLFILKNKDELKRMFIVIACFSIVLVGINITSGEKILSRFKTLSNDVNIVVDVINENSAQNVKNLEKLGSNRGKIWSMTARSIMKNPIIGTGPDTLHHRLMRDLEDEFLYMAIVQKTCPDKAHNEYLEYWATGGITTLLAYLCLVISMLIKLFKIKDDKTSKVYLLIIVGYLVQATFNISVIQVAPIYWIILGLASQFIIKNNHHQIDKPTDICIEV